MRKKSKMDQEAYPGSLMTKREHLASMKEFNKRPGEKAKLDNIRKSNREMLHGKGIITRGKNKGLKKGTGTQSYKSK